MTTTTTKPAPVTETKSAPAEEQFLPIPTWKKVAAVVAIVVAAALLTISGFGIAALAGASVGAFSAWCLTVLGATAGVSAGLPALVSFPFVGIIAAIAAKLLLTAQPVSERVKELQVQYNTLIGKLQGQSDPNTIAEIAQQLDVIVTELATHGHEPKLDKTNTIAQRLDERHRAITGAKQRLGEDKAREAFGTIVVAIYHWLRDNPDAKEPFEGLQRAVQVASEKYAIDKE